MEQRTKSLSVQRPLSYKTNFKTVFLNQPIVFILGLLLLGGCNTGAKVKHTPPGPGQAAITPAPVAEKPLASTTGKGADKDSIEKNKPDNSFYRPGTGRFIAKQSIAAAKVQKNGDIKLNFQNANLLEVIKIILSDMLNAAYVVSPRVQGSVSMQTSKPLHRDNLLPTLELLLRMNQAALITDSNLYKVVPLANAATSIQQPQLGDSAIPLPPGYNVRIVPLKYVSADEMSQILTPFTNGTNQLLRADSKRNLLVLAASGHDMERLLETIRIFDVDRMQGMSVAMFTPDFVSAKTLSEELEQLLTDEKFGPVKGLVRFILVERLNGLMVVTPSAEYLKMVRSWVQRLDKDNGSVGQRLFIYRVQNGEAADLAKLLNDLFNPTTNSNPTLAPAQVAPGLQATTVGQTADTTDNKATATSPTPVPEPMPNGNLANNANNQAQVRIMADEPNNALLIMASATEYRQILYALKQLDISPMQVLVEVTIAEVTLTDNLEYGVEWFFNNKIGSGLTGLGTLDLGVSGIAGITPGFSYAFTGGDGTVNAVINLLETESNLSIVSSPTLLVLNNEEATIEVGDEVPVSTQQQQSTEANANIVNSIEYRQTGVLLKVKPRINAGGLVIMEVEQETSSANDSDLTPRIQTRKINSTVAVNSGDTIILGGLIEDNRLQAESGLPGLSKVPIVGKLFGTTTGNQDRTELLVLITPRAISHRVSALQATEEFRHKLHSLIPVKTNLFSADSEILQDAQP